MDSRSKTLRQRINNILLEAMVESRRKMQDALSSESNDPEKFMQIEAEERANAIAKILEKEVMDSMKQMQNDIDALKKRIKGF